MAAGDAVTKGQAWKLHFGNLTLTGYMPEDFTEKDTADDEVIRDERNATCTHILTNPAVMKTGSFLIRSTGSITPPAKGDFIWLKGPSESAFQYYYVDDATVSFSRGISKLSLSIMLEDSQTGGATFTETSTQQYDGAQFDTGTPADVDVGFDMGTATDVVRVITSTGTILTETTDWAYSEGTLTLDKDGWLATAITGVGVTGSLWIEFDQGAPCYLTVTGIA